MSYEDAHYAVPSTVRTSAKASRIEGEAMELFDEFRNPLLRYGLSLRLSINDAEEVIQEGIPSPVSTPSLESF